MNRSVYLDVNIVIDLLDTKRTNHIQTKDLISHIYKNDIKIVISEDMLSTIFYIVKDKKSVLNFFKVIQKHWVISPFGKEVISQAIELALEKNADLEDVLQCLCAKQNQCESLITHDHFFIDCGLKVATVAEYLK